MPNDSSVLTLGMFPATRSKSLFGQLNYIEDRYAPCSFDIAEFEPRDHMVTHVLHREEGLFAARRQLYPVTLVYMSLIKSIISTIDISP